MKRRFFTLWSGCLIWTVLFSACAPRSVPDSQPATTVTFGISGTQTVEADIQARVRATLTVESRAGGEQSGDVDTHDAIAIVTGDPQFGVVSIHRNGEILAAMTEVDARGTIEEDHPDVKDVIKVIEVSADIPNDGVQFVTGFDPEIRAQIVAALLAIAETEEGQEALDTAYSWNALEEHDDTFYDPFRQVLDAAGVSAEDF